MFEIGYRDRISSTILAWADADSRIVSGAIVGSLASPAPDRWSDLDLTFAVADDVSIPEVLDEWTRRLSEELDALHLFDVSLGSSVYRVFLLPGCLQFDLSFTPACDFGAIGPRFKLLFGEATQKTYIQSPSKRDLVGYAAHHALRGRISIERKRLCQAEYWISSARDYVLGLACLHRGFPVQFARGTDELPVFLKQFLNDSLVKDLNAEELQRALVCVVNQLTTELIDDRSTHFQNIVDRLKNLTIPSL